MLPVPSSVEATANAEQSERPATAELGCCPPLNPSILAVPVSDPAFGVFYSSEGGRECIPIAFDLGQTVHELPETRESLLLQVRDPSDRRAWEEFVEIYRPAVYRVAVARGLQHADALDVVQTVFISVANAIGSWQKRGPEGRFRHWLLRVAKNATINAVTRTPRDRPHAGEAEEAMLRELPQPDPEAESLVELEYRRELFVWAAERAREEVHPDTWKAFELTAIEGMSKEDAAREIGKSIGTIYAARSRVMRRLSALVERYVEDRA